MSRSPRTVSHAIETTSHGLERCHHRERKRERAKPISQNVLTQHSSLYAYVILSSVRTTAVRSFFKVRSATGPQLTATVMECSYMQRNVTKLNDLTQHRGGTTNLEPKVNFEPPLLLPYVTQVLYRFVLRYPRSTIGLAQFTPRLSRHRKRRYSRKLSTNLKQSRRNRKVWNSTSVY